MAKENRFPADANRKKKSAEPKQSAEPPKEVEGKKEPLVQIQYNKENHHLLDHVYAIRKGLNHVPRWVWEKTENHPTIVQLIKDGHLKVVQSKKSEEPKEV